MGVTTYVDARIFLDTINTPNTQSIIIAQDETNSKRIFQMVRRYYDNLPPDKKRVANTDSKGELWWKDIDSYFFVGWAGSKKIGRGGTINNAHLSEVAFWENAEEIISGLGQSVPKDGNIFQESTANGVGNYFYREYQSALKNESVYKPRFYAWFELPTYRSDTLTNDEEFIPDREELELQKLYNLDDRQLIWRRNKATELKNTNLAGDDSVGDFPQEYPSNPQEAFLRTGQNIFDAKLLDRTIAPNAKPALNLEIPIKHHALKAGVALRNCKLRIFSRPTLGKYLVIADPSEGLSTQGDHDYCGTHVINMETWEQVATLRGRWEPNDYAGMLVDLGRWYNTATIVVERNNHGHAVLNSLINHFEYENVYFHKEYDAKTKLFNRKPGYPTNVKTKALALASCIELVNDVSLKINCPVTIEELRNYCKLPGGKTGASTGHDDMVTSLMIGADVLKTEIVLVTKREKKKPIKKIFRKNPVSLGNML